MSITVLSSSRNPDSASIANKEQIDISLSIAEVSASGHSGSIFTNYSATVQVVTIPEENLCKKHDKIPRRCWQYPRNHSG